MQRDFGNYQMIPILWWALGMAAAAILMRPVVRQPVIALPALVAMCAVVLAGLKGAG